MKEVVVVSGARTAIGTFGGSLKDVPPTQLGAIVVREALKRAQVDGADVGHVVFGHVINTEPRDMYLGRVAAVDGGVAHGTPCLTRQPAVRQWPAGHYFFGADHPARRHRDRARRWRRVNVTRAVCDAIRTLGPAHG